MRVCWCTGSLHDLAQVGSFAAERCQYSPIVSWSECRHWLMAGFWVSAVATPALAAVVAV